MNFIKYKKNTGQIVSLCCGPEGVMKLNESDIIGTLRGECDSCSTHRVDLKTKRIVKRSKNKIAWNKLLIKADEIDLATATGIPKGADVLVIGAGTHTSITINDGTLEVTANAPGEYIVQIQCFPFLDHEVIINGEN